MDTSSGREPTNAELVELLEKQDVMLDSLHDELNRTRNEIKRMMEEDDERKESQLMASTVISEAARKVNTALSTVEILHAHNEKLEAEIVNLQKKMEEDRPIAAILTIKEENKKIEQSLNEEKRLNTSLQNEKEDLQMEIKQLKHELSSQSGRYESLISSLTDRLNSSTHELAATKFKLDSFEADREHSSVRLEGHVEVLSQKEKHMDELFNQLNKEMSTLRKEKNILAGRVSVLSQENATLRNKVLQRTPQSDGSADDEQLRRLMSDQSHLISALREETKMLTDRLEEERRESKNRMKDLRREKRELQERLDRVLRI